MSSAAPQQQKKKFINRAKTTMVADPLALNPDCSWIHYDPPSTGTIQQGDQIIKTWRIQLAAKNPQTEDEIKRGLPPTLGDIVLRFDRSFCFGVSEMKSDAGATQSYSCAIPLWDREGATPRQIASSKLISAIAEKCKDILLSDDIMSSVERFNKEGLERAELKKLDPLYWQKDKGKIKEGTGPTFYPKLMWMKSSRFKKKQKNKDGVEEEVLIEKPSKMFTIFYDEEEVDEMGQPREVDPLSFMGKYFYITPLIKIESVFIGAKITMQCKVYEADTKALETQKRKLLHMSSSLSVPKGPVLSLGGTNPLMAAATVVAPKDDSKSENRSEGESIVLDASASQEGKKGRVIKKKIGESK